MDFFITRTSGNLDGESPCKGAFKKSVPIFEVRSCTEQEFNKKFSANEGLWRSKGTNHTVTDDGYIKRQIGYEDFWFISINSLDELINFHKEQGELIIESNYRHEGFTIEIYDDYRE